MQQCHGDVKNQMHKTKPTNLKIKSAERNKSVYGCRRVFFKGRGVRKLAELVARFVCIFFFPASLLWVCFKSTRSLWLNKTPDFCLNTFPVFKVLSDLLTKNSMRTCIW